MSRIAFILHGKNRQNQRLKNEFLKITPSGFESSFFETRQSGQAISLTQQVLTDGCEFVIAVGGDGLLNEVVNGYLQCSELIRNTAALGVFPAGTGNDFSKTIGIKRDFQQLSELIQLNQPGLIDACLMQFVDTNHKSSERYYFNIANIGIGGYVAQRVNRSRKWLGSNLTYMKAIVSAFLSYKHPTVTIVAEQFEREGKILSVVMANGKYFGSGLCIAPGANLDDGKLQIVVLGNLSLMDYFKYLGTVQRGELINHPEVSYFESKFCNITSGDECPIDMDGEFIGYAPVKVNVMEKAVRFLA